MSKILGKHTSYESKNYLINSAFDIWNRGTSTTIANGSTAYQADRWYAKNSLGTNGVLTYSRIAGTLNGSKYSAKLQITTEPTVAQANGCEFYQVLENLDSLDLINENISFAVNIKALNNVTQVGLQFCYATTEVKPTLFFGSEQVVDVNSASFTKGILINQNSSTNPTNAGVIGVRIRILSVSSGNTYSLNNGFILEQAQLNLGSTIPPFSKNSNSIQEELAKCSRYFWTGQFSSSCLADSAALFVMTAAFKFPVPLRSSPSLSSGNFSSLSFTGYGISAGLFDSPLSFSAILAVSTDYFQLRTNNPNSRATGSTGTMAGTISVDVDI